MKTSADIPKVSIIVVSYNTREMTLECLRSIYREATSDDFEVIVLDNASEDGSADAIEHEFGENVSLIRSSENCGFARGNNRAADVARGEFILLLNPDTVVLDRAIDKILEFAFRRPGAGIWGGRTVFGDGALNPGSCWGRQTLWSLICQALGLMFIFRKSSVFDPEGMGGWDREGEREVDIVTGCFLLLKRDFWNQLGGFRPAFFMYGEEVDLCLRAKSVGALPAVSSSAVIVHYGGASEKVLADKIIRLLKSKMLLIQFHFSSFARPIGRTLLGLWPITRYVGHLILMHFGRKSSTESARVWGEVVARRREWWVVESTD